MKKTSTVQAFQSEIFKGQKLTIGLDLGDRWSFYCVMDEAGQVLFEQKLPTITAQSQRASDKALTFLGSWTSGLPATVRSVRASFPSNKQKSAQNGRVN
jgi:hypothetical protein